MIRSLNRTLLLGTLSVACLGAAVSLAVSAQDPAPAADTVAPAEAAPAAEAPAAAAPATGSAERGKALAYTCQGCHGVTGYKNVYPSYHVPKIVGQSPEYLTAALAAYKNGTRTHGTMQAQATSFSDQDIADIAAYLSSLKK